MRGVKQAPTWAGSVALNALLELWVTVICSPERLIRVCLCWQCQCSMAALWMRSSSEVGCISQGDEWLYQDTYLRQ